MEKTFVIIKPDAVEAKHAGKILSRIEKEGFRVVAFKRRRISKEEAEAFYGEHRGKGFFGSLVTYMTSGPVYVAVLEREHAVSHWRAVMGATDPSKAADGTIRKLHATSIGENSVHGSDAPETAAIEIAQFFSGNEIVG